MIFLTYAYKSKNEGVFWFPWAQILMSTFICLYFLIAIVLFSIKKDSKLNKNNQSNFFYNPKTSRGDSIF